MKKLGMILLALMLVFALVFGLVTSCGSDDDSTPPPKKPAKCECGTEGCACTTACPTGCTCSCCKVDVIIHCEYCDEDYVEGQEAAHFNDCFCPICLEEWVDCDCVYIARVLTVIQDGSGGTSVVPSTPLDDYPDGENTSGKGFIIGKQFEWLKDAKRGSKVRVLLNGTQNMNWDSIGAVGIGSMENQDRLGIDPRAVTPDIAGDYQVEFEIERYWRVSGFGEATYGNVNIWGTHKVQKVIFLIPKTPVTGNVTPTAADFYINASLTQFISEGINQTPVTITPRYNMSKGAITIKFDGNTAVPATVGNYPVTFDVAASDYFEAVTLNAGTLEILAVKHYFWDYLIGGELSAVISGSNLQFTGASSANVRNATYFIVETKTPDPAPGTGFGSISFIINADPGWAAGQVNNVTGTVTGLTRVAGETIYIVINIKETHASLIPQIGGWAELFFQGGTGGVIGIGAQKAYLTNGNVPKPAGALDFGTPARGYVYKLP